MNNIRSLIRSIVEEQRLIEEAKDHLIKKIPSLTPEQKEILIEKYRGNPALEGLFDINWNRLNDLTWDSFKDVLEYVSKTKEKKDIKVSGAEVLFENKDVLVIKPLTKDASICYGKGTKWCTAAMTYNQFIYYFSKKNVTLIYVINKNSDTSYNNLAKIAVAIYPEGSYTENEYFNSADGRINDRVFYDKTDELGVPRDIFKWHEDTNAREEANMLGFAIKQNDYDKIKYVLDKGVDVTDDHIIELIKQYTKDHDKKKYDLVIDYAIKKGDVFGDKIPYGIQGYYLRGELWDEYIELCNKTGHYNFSNTNSDSFAMYVRDDGQNGSISDSLYKLIDFTFDKDFFFSSEDLNNILYGLISNDDLDRFRKYSKEFAISDELVKLMFEKSDPIKWLEAGGVKDYRLISAFASWVYTKFIKHGISVDRIDQKLIDYVKKNTKQTDNRDARFPEVQKLIWG